MEQTHASAGAEAAVEDGDAPPPSETSYIGSHVRAQQLQRLRVQQRAKAMAARGAFSAGDFRADDDKSQPPELADDDGEPGARPGYDADDDSPENDAVDARNVRPTVTSSLRSVVSVQAPRPPTYHRGIMSTSSVENVGDLSVGKAVFNTGVSQERGEPDDDDDEEEESALAVSVSNAREGVSSIATSRRRALQAPAQSDDNEPLLTAPRYSATQRNTLRAPVLRGRGADVTSAMDAPPPNTVAEVVDRGVRFTGAGSALAQKRQLGTASLGPPPTRSTVNATIDDAETSLQKREGAPLALPEVRQPLQRPPLQPQAKQQQQHALAALSIDVLEGVSASASRNTAPERVGAAARQAQTLLNGDSSKTTRNAASQRELREAATTGLARADEVNVSATNSDERLIPAGAPLRGAAVLDDRSAVSWESSSARTRGSDRRDDDRGSDASRRAMAGLAAQLRGAACVRALHVGSGVGASLPLRQLDLSQRDALIEQLSAAVADATAPLYRGSHDVLAPGAATRQQIKIDDSVQRAAGGAAALSDLPVSAFRADENNVASTALRRGDVARAPSLPSAMPHRMEAVLTPALAEQFAEKASAGRGSTTASPMALAERHGSSAQRRSAAAYAPLIGSRRNEDGDGARAQAGANSTDAADAQTEKPLVNMTLPWVRSQGIDRAVGGSSAAGAATRDAHNTGATLAQRDDSYYQLQLASVTAGSTARLPAAVTSASRRTAPVAVQVQQQQQHRLRSRVTFVPALSASARRVHEDAGIAPPAPQDGADFEA